jgi:hypothetical protein
VKRAEASGSSTWACVPDHPACRILLPSRSRDISLLDQSANAPVSGIMACINELETIQQHPGLTFVRSLYQCRELGAALARYATAATVANVRRTIGAGESPHGNSRLWMLTHSCPGLSPS